MYRSILIYGLAAGLIVGIPNFAMPVALKDHPPLAYGMLIGYAIMLVALSAIFLAIKSRRDRDLGGVIGFGQAFAIGLGITVIATIFYVLAWEAAMAVTHMDFAGGYAKELIAEKKASGASAQELANLSAQMEAFKVNYANPLYRMTMVSIEIFPVGVLVSLFSAGLLRFSRFLPARRA